MTIAACCLFLLGVEVAISNTLTSRESAGSLVWLIVYVALVLLVPALLVAAGRQHRRADRVATIRRASALSLLCQLLFLPLLLALAAM